jgi:hypothetical protein
MVMIEQGGTAERAFKAVDGTIDNMITTLLIIQIGSHFYPNTDDSPNQTFFSSFYPFLVILQEVHFQSHHFDPTKLPFTTI